MKKNIFVNFLLIFFLHLLTEYDVASEKDHARIFDGSEAPAHTYPWMVSIRLNFLGLVKRDCGGVILSNIFVLTAASCFQNLTVFAPYFSIKAGLHTIGSISETTEQTRLVLQLIQHPNYTNTSYLNDLALVRVSPPFRLEKSTVYPIKLSNLKSVENMNLTIIGWSESNPGVMPISLKKVIVQENVQCTQRKSVDPLTQLCASGK